MKIDRHIIKHPATDLGVFDRGVWLLFDSKWERLDVLYSEQSFKDYVDYHHYELGYNIAIYDKTGELVRCPENK